MSEDKPKNLTKIAEEEGLVALLKEACYSLDSIATGAVGTGRQDIYMIPGRLVQGVRNKTFIKQLGEEFENLKEKGRIKKDYIHTEQGMACLQELLAALEEPPVNEVRFEALKAIFLTACTEDFSNSEDVLPQLLLNVARNLDSGELVLLASMYSIKLKATKDDAHIKSKRLDDWYSLIITRSSLSSKSLVQLYEEKLIAKKLIDGPNGSLRQIVYHENSRLTDLGLKLCEFMHKDEEVPKA